MKKRNERNWEIVIVLFVVSLIFIFGGYMCDKYIEMKKYEEKCHNFVNEYDKIERSYNEVQYWYSLLECRYNEVKRNEELELNPQEGNRTEKQEDDKVTIINKASNEVKENEQLELSPQEGNRTKKQQSQKDEKCPKFYELMNKEWVKVSLSLIEAAQIRMRIEEVKIWLDQMAKWKVALQEGKQISGLPDVGEMKTTIPWWMFFCKYLISNSLTDDRREKIRTMHVYDSSEKCRFILQQLGLLQKVFPNGNGVGLDFVVTPSLWYALNQIADFEEDYVTKFGENRKELTVEEGIDDNNGKGSWTLSYVSDEGWWKLAFKPDQQKGYTALSKSLSNLTKKLKARSGDTIKIREPYFDKENSQITLSIVGKAFPCKNNDQHPKNTLVDKVSSRPLLCIEPRELLTNICKNGQPCSYPDALYRNMFFVLNIQIEKQN